MKSTPKLFSVGMAALVLAGCTGEKLSDAYGQFEADEVVISAETQGQLLALDLQEGDRLEEGVMVGRIDTIRISLQKRELEARMTAIGTRIEVLEAQKQVHESRLETASRELSRVESLLQENAATRRQLDHASGEVNTWNRQIHAVEAEKASVRAELEQIRVQMEQLDDRMRRARIVNPVAGTVLAKYTEPFEQIAPGQPLYRIANLDEMELRAYVSGSRLPDVRLGGQVQVRVDAPGGGIESLQGTVSWVSSRAEFTPRMIQTREERITQVYAVRIRVPNPDGRLKIGMPGEVNFN